MKKKLTEIDELIRSGQTELAAERITALRRGKLGREARYELASAARKAGLPEVTLALLRPVVRATDRHAPQGTAAEKTVYGAALLKVGAVEEAVQILDSVDSRAVADKDLFSAHALMNQWDYARAIAPLKNYVSRPDVSADQRLVGTLNLAAALVHERHYAESAPLLEELIAETERRGMGEFLGNALELSVQQAIGRRNWANVESALARANFFRAGSGIYSLYLEKWAAVYRFEKDRDPGALAELARVRAEAHRRRYSEVVRHSDMLLAGWTKNSRLLAHVYFGTPFAAFRRLAVLSYGEPVAFPKRYRWHLGKKTRGAVSFVVPETAAAEKRHFTNEKVALRLLRILASDFYRPFRVASLFGQLFPSEFYNPASSPDRVYHAVKCARRWFTDEKLPLRVRRLREGYTLSADAACDLVVPGALPRPASEPPVAHQLARRFGERPFSVTEATAALQVSRRTASRVLSTLVQTQNVVRTGAGNATLYHFPRKQRG